MSKNHVTERTDNHSDVLRLAVYSDRPQLREEVHTTLGSTVSPQLPPVELVDFATGPALLRALSNKEIDLCILDGETAPLGGMGLAYQIKSEIKDPPPSLVLLQRRDDAWLATWSRADAVYPLPIDPIELPRAVAGLLLDKS